jgi:molecular chaperone DnaJ
VKQKEDYYHLLGVQKEATASEIKKAFRHLALQYHPDRNSEPNAEARFKLINEAYAILSDPEKRQRYDRYGHSEAVSDPFQGGFNQSDLEEIFGADVFNDLFASLFGGRKRKIKRDLHVQLEIPLLTVLKGGVHQFEVQRKESCSHCFGYGTRDGHPPQQCNACHGTGKIQVQRGFMAMVQPCPKCKGKGKAIYHPCGQCKGTGNAPKVVYLEIDVPPGAHEGQTLCVRQQGDLINGKRGDVYVHLQIQEHDTFENEELDLILPYSVRYTQLTLGDQIKVTTLDGKEIKVKIPSGTQASQSLRLKGKGLPSINGHRFGDLLIRLEVDIPKALTATERELLVALDLEQGGNLRPPPSSDSLWNKIGQWITPKKD